MKLLDYFDRIYIVNLPERSDRRREMNAELARLGLAVDGKRIRYFRAVRPADAGDFPSLGARGCFMSHLEILREARGDGLENVLVLEDDLSIDLRLAEAQPEMLSQLQSRNWDFAYIGHVENTEALTQPVWQVSNSPMATTHCYALSHRAIGEVLEHLEACLTRKPGHPLGSPMHVDGAYSLLRMRSPHLKTLMAVPSLGGQRSSRSDIYPNKWYDRLPFFQQLAGLARGGKNWVGRFAN